jgi:hypothetical protein
MSPNKGGGEGACEVSANEDKCAHGAHIDFGDLTPYLTNGPPRSMQERKTKDLPDAEGIKTKLDEILWKIFLSPAPHTKKIAEPYAHDEVDHGDGEPIPIPWSPSPSKLTTGSCAGSPV